jgi:SAM-dependent methyltransferase
VPADDDDAADERPATGDDGLSFSDHWRRELLAQARAHWTSARVAELARGKALLLPPVEAAPLLRAMGLLHRGAEMPPKQVRKYWQICHMVTLLGGAVRARLAERATVRILDAGCGRSYLSMALAWVVEHRWGGRAQILGIDRNPALIAESQLRAERAGVGHALRFCAADLCSADVAACWRQAFADEASAVAAGDDGRCIDALFSLHACDTATCDALAIAALLGAPLIAVAPCCQAELARGWATLAEGGAVGPFRAIWGSPHLRRETGADVTDAMRALLLRACGYQVSAIEFVPAQHTRKNTLLRAIASPAPTPAERAAALAEYHALVAATGGVGLALAARLPLAEAAATAAAAGPLDR